MQLNKLMQQIKAKYPSLEVELLLMDLAGQVEKVGGIGKVSGKADH